MRGVFVEDYGDGNIAKEFFEMPFVLEGVEERSVFHFFQNFYGDAAGYVDAAQGEHFEGEVTSFGAVDVGPQVDGCDANRASFVEAVLSNFWSGVGVGVGESRVGAKSEWPPSEAPT